ncbi:MAG: penicillin-binding protein 1C [Candidatus Eremiobacteraeota bacterium]|nr:penicillin-binding protein 1C [Candidatus Eremiobacteraeota bacterium]
MARLRSLSNSSRIKTTFSLRLAILCLAAPVLLFFAALGALRIDVAHFERQQAAVVFEDRSGLPLGTVLPSDGEHASSIPLERIAPSFIAAVIATEDARFYRHGGVDIAAVLRSARQLVQTGAPVSGASTITMQVARMLYHPPASMRGKVREAWLAWCIEAGSSKNAILSAYVNRLPMGGNLYGVEAAAQSYFGAQAADLDLAQSALLAAIPNDPVRLNPRTHWRALKNRQFYILQRMRATGAVTDAQAQRAAGEDLHLAAPARGILAGAHLLFALASNLPVHTSHVRTTIDRPLQQFIETQMRALLAALAERNVHQGAALVIDNRTGEVLAYVGSPDYFDDDNHGRNDGVRALRQPGSALKPFLYELALERGVVQPNSILADVPVTYAIANGQLYSPSDYSNAYAGPVRVRLALANSLNVPAVRVLSRVGTGVFLDRLHALGFEHLTRPPEYYGLGLTLGGGEVSLWELTHAYLTLARAGSAIPLRTVISNDAPNGAQTGSPRLWWLITDFLSDSHARAHSFGAASILDLPFPTAVKTGTSSDFRDTWTVGYSREYTVGVWVGNFNGAAMRHVSGVTGAAPLWHRIMLRLHQNHEPLPFSKPAGFVRRSICASSGLKPLTNCDAVVTEYLSPAQVVSYGKPGRSTLPRTYDEWLGAQGVAPVRASDVRILFPHQDDRFILNRTDDAIEVAPMQAIAFHVRTFVNAPVTWSLNGVRVATTASDTYTWRLRPGTWHLESQTAARHDSVTFTVVRATQRTRRGFSF